MTDTRRRVKLYALNAERQWDDKGTGHVSSTYVERLKGISLLVRAEADGSLLLESKIQPDTAYQKQQETLIVWSEGDNFDLALSFQEKAGCDEIWEKICQVQGKDPSVDFTQDIIEESEDERCFDEMSDSVPPIELPSCELGRLEEISELVSSCLPSPIRREKLAVAVENEGYIKKLLNLFHMCEDLENMEGLHHLYEIFKNVFLLNKNALFELMFAEDTIFDVVGCLEFDPGLPTPKRHRQYLRSIATFHQVIPISNPELMSKIHQTYRVQYIQDVVLPTPSVFEENMLSTLSSFIFFNKVDIVSQIQEDEKFLTELFQQLTDDKTECDRRRELVLFLKEFCTFSQTLQPQARESFFKTLNTLGVLQALEITLAADNRQTKSASVDILLFIVDFSPSMVREYMLQQLNNTDDDSLLMNVIIEQMTCDSDPEMGSAVQLMGIIRTLLDPENMLASVNKSEKTDFLNYFYKHCMHVFISPLLANTGNDKPETNDPCTVQLLSLILELLSFCVEHHTYHIKNYILHKDLLRRILVLMKSQHTFLVLCALRFMRKIIALKDEFYNRYIIKGNLFAPVIDAFVMNNGRYNLLDSAILEMFEHIKLEDIKSLCTHVVEHFGPTLDKITYVQTFKALKLRYDQHQDRQKDRQAAQLENVNSILRPGRFRRDPRQLDEEEEMWFNDDEYEDENGPNANSSSTSGQVINAVNSNISQSTSVGPNCSTQVHQSITGSNNSPTISGLPSTSPTGGSPLLGGSNNAAVSSAVSLAAAAAVAACGAAASSPLAAAAAVAASAGATVGFSAVVDGVVAGDSDTSVMISQGLEGQTILSDKEDGSKPILSGALSNVKKALVDYDSDEDEDEDDDDDEVCEDDDGREVDNNRQSDLKDEIAFSSTANDNATTGALENKGVKPADTIEANPPKPENSDVQTETSLHSTDSLLKKSAIDTQKITDKTTDHTKEGLNEQNSTESDNIADTHDYELSTQNNCNNSIVQKSSDDSEKQQLLKDNVNDKKEDDIENSNATSEKDLSSGENSTLNIVRVSSDGDGKTHVTVPSLIRSNECLEDNEDGPASKRQRLCTIEDQKIGDLHDPEISDTSEAKLQ